MEYNELKQLWDTNEDTEMDISLNQKALQELTQLKIKENLSDIKWNSILEIVITFFWYIFLLNFLIDNYQEFTFLSSGIILMAITVLSFFFEFRKLYLYKSINFTSSIAKAQKQLEKLRLTESLDNNLLYIIIPLFFVPFALVFSKGFLDINLIEIGFGVREMFYATLSSFIVAVIIVFILRKTEFKKINESLQFLREIQTLEED